MAAEHGTRSRYNAGCKCELCAEAERTYKRERRAKKREQDAAGPTAAPAASVVAQLPTTAAPQDGQSVEQAVAAEIAKRDTSTRPGLVATALALARVLDSKGAIMQHASAAARLTDILNQIAGMATKRQSPVSQLRKDYTGS